MMYHCVVSVLLSFCYPLILSFCVERDNRQSMILHTNIFYKQGLPVRTVQNGIANDTAQPSGHHLDLFLSTPQPSQDTGES